MATKSVRKLSRDAHRQRMHHRVRQRVVGTPVRPRLCVYRSLGHIYAQVIDDLTGRTLASASSLDKSTRAALKGGGNVAAAKIVGKTIAERSLAAGSPAGRVRSRRLYVSRPRRGSRQRRPRSGIEVLIMSKHILRETLAVRRPIEVSANNLKDQVVSIQRVTKVVKGGKNLSFSALVVVGDQRGHAGFGMGKAREVPMAIRKAIEQAKKNLIRLNLKGTSIPHQVVGFYGSGQVLLKPASEGTGIIAGGPVRAVMEVAGISNVLTKSIGTSNPHNVIKATFDALLRLKDEARVAELRSKPVEELRS